MLKQSSGWTGGGGGGGGGGLTLPQLMALYVFVLDDDVEKARGW